ncbi:ABC transporter ATP-binding protein [Streptomyces sp. URMC 123]|uniref:ABC transporter ATP-binding protein n=1 Tax=Streptomyces sp. URMC 123 TaxID=3423403 RepID=UPI003F1C572F
MSTDTTGRTGAGAPSAAVPPPRPAPPPDIQYVRDANQKRAENASLRQMAARLPAAIARAARLGWQVDRRAVLYLVLCQLVAGATSAVMLTATTEAMAHLLAAGTARERILAALPSLVVIGAAATVNRIAAAWSLYSSRRLTPLMVTAGDLGLVDAMFRVELSAHDEPDFTEAHQAAETGITRMQFLAQDSQTCMAAIAQMIAAAGVLTVLHPLLLPCLVLAVLPTGIASVLTTRMEYATHHRNMGDRNVRGLMRWYALTPKLADEVRANTMSAYLRYWFTELSARIDARTRATAPRMLRVGLLGYLGGGLMLVLTWVTLAWLAITGRVDMAVAATAVVAVRTSTAALTSLISAGVALFRTGLYLDDWQAFLRRTDELAAVRGTLDPGPPTEIRLKSATFTFPTKTEPALHDIDLTLRRGEVVALVGENGSGKTTLSRMVTGLFLPTSGSVRWNGVDLAEADPERVWSHVGLVPQFFANWPMAARENITLGQPRSHGDTDVWRAADAAGLPEVIDALPDGLDTLLARTIWGGHELSGGQWQRFACARALYREPPVLVLDEPTSDLDARAEHKIFQALRRIAPDRITVVVTHQLDNTRMADRIVVLRHGRIVEEGTFDELTKAGGLFQELYALSQDR